MAQRTHKLSRSEIRQETDKPTRSLILRYTGSTLYFDEYIYGYPDGTFFYVQLDDVPWPPHLEELAQELGIAIDPLPEAPRLRQAVADALVSGVLVDAPEYMEDLGVDRPVAWQEWDRRELERKHRIAEARVVEIARLIENDMKMRYSGFKKPSFEMPKAEDFVPTLPPVAPAPTIVVKTEAEECDEPEPAVEKVEARVDTEDDDVEDSVYHEGSQTVRRIEAAVHEARQEELPQRLPGGMRRRLRKVPPAAYLMYDGLMEPRVDLCAALTDARALGRKDREVVVVDYDGEWPVVARRFGQDGRTIYKVETALRRYGIDVPEVQ